MRAPATAFWAWHLGIPALKDRRRLLLFLSLALTLAPAAVGLLTHTL